MSVLNEFPYNLVPSLPIINKNLEIDFVNLKKKKKKTKQNKKPSH